MECPLWRLLISSWSVSKHGYHRNLVGRRRLFRNRPIRNKNCMWWPSLLTDQDEMSNLHRGHSIDPSYQVSAVAMFVNRSGRNEQSSLSFLKAEWKVSDTGSAHWTSSLIVPLVFSNVYFIKKLDDLLNIELLEILFFLHQLPLSAVMLVSKTNWTIGNLFMWWLSW
jgi:hypothetical protein